MREEHDLTIRIQWSENSYSGGDSDASATLTLSAPQFPDGIVITYSDDYFRSQILSAILRDLEEYISDPKGWVKDYIQKGADMWEKLRDLESEIAEDREQIKSHEHWQKVYERSVVEKEQRLAALRATLEAKERR